MSSWKLSERADADLLDIYRYGFERYGKRLAVDYLTSLEDCFSTLAAYPQMGREAETIGEGVRRFEHRRHVILYDIGESGVLILALVHERNIRRLKL